ncbi:MAG: DsbC family protein [Deltaproteobacteria bacterium]|nr:DsbC family protein [Deltaproteobacteria bacterium]
MRRGNILITTVLSITTLLFVGHSDGFETPSGSEQKCSACHTLTKEEAATLLKADRFNATIREVRPGPVKGFWEVVIEKDGKGFPIYVDFAKENLVEGRITPFVALSKPPSLKMVDLKTIPVDDAVIMGNRDAEKKVIVFDDPDCPYCRKLHVEIKKIIEKRPDVAFLIMLYPLDIHPQAYDKSKAILCEKSVKLLDDALTGKALPTPTCDAPGLDRSIASAKSLGINGTPAIIFPDGRLLPGFVEADVLLNLLDNPPEE